VPDGYGSISAPLISGGENLYISFGVLIAPIIHPSLTHGGGGGGGGGGVCDGVTATTAAPELLDSDSTEDCGSYPSDMVVTLKVDVRIVAQISFDTAAVF
jgi:hypothetical protein